MSETTVEDLDAEQKALQELGIPPEIQGKIKTLVTDSTEAMERYGGIARAAADKVEKNGASDSQCNRLHGALYMHAETVKFRESFTDSSTGIPPLDEAFKRGIQDDGLDAENLKRETSGPVASCLAKALLTPR